MSKLLPVFAGVAAVAMTTGASAQYYDHPHHWGHGYGHSLGGVHTLEYRIHNVLRSLDGVRPDQREQLREQAISLDHQLRDAASYGLNPRQYHYFDVRIGQLERHQHWASMNRGYRYYHGM